MYTLLVGHIRLLPHLYKYLGSTANFCSEFFRVLIVLPLPGLAVFRGGSRMSEKGVQMCNGREGVALLISSHSSPVSHENRKKMASDFGENRKG